MIYFKLLTYDCTVGMRNIPDDIRYFSLSSPFQKLESLYYRLHSILSYQTICNKNGFDFRQSTDKNYLKTLTENLSKSVFCYK